MKSRLLKGLAAIALSAVLATSSAVVPFAPQTATVVEAAAKAKTVSIKVGDTYKTGLKNIKSVKSSNEKVATVSKKGVIKALKAGKTNITVVTKNAGTKQFSITVPEPSFKKTKATLEKGKTFKIKALQIKNLKWKSSNTKVATVKNGLVKAVGEGKATITGKAGNTTLKFTITVNKPSSSGGGNNGGSSGSGDNGGNSGSGNNGGNSGSGNNGGNTQPTSNVSQPTIVYSLSDVMMDDGSGSGEPVAGQMVQATVKFNGFPKTVNDLKKIKRGNGQGNETNRQYDGKFLTVACTLAALAAYSEGRDAEGQAMMEYLMVSPSISKEKVGSAGKLSYYFEYNNKKQKLPWVYLDGATQFNNYTPTQPYATTMEEYLYKISPSTIYGVYLQCEGVRFNSNVHPALKQHTDKIIVYEDPQDHQWYLWPSGFAQLLTDASIKVIGEP